MTTIVIGGEHVGAALAERLRESSAVVFLDERPEIVDRAHEIGIDGHVVDATDRRELQDVVADSTKTVVVTTGKDSTNLLIGQHLRTACDVDQIVVLVNDPRNRVAFTDRGFITVCAVQSLTESLIDAIEDTEQPRHRSVVDSTQ